MIGKVNNPLFDIFSKELEEAVKKAYSLDIKEFNIVKPPDKGLGDLSFACYNLAKELKENPQKIAEKLLPHCSEKISKEKAYLNIKFSSKDYELVLKDILFKDFFDNKINSKEKTMIEYSQPNTHKDLHVGHMLNLCLGKSLVNLYKYFNLEVVSATFPGDVGTHVAKTLYFLNQYLKDNPKPEDKKGEFLGDIYVKASGYLAELEKKCEKGEGLEEKEKIDKEISLILNQIQNESGPYFSLWQETREWSIDLMKKIYKWTNTSFDKWYFESDVDKTSVAYVKELFKEGKLIESEGAIGLDLSSENLSFALLLKKDGNGLYLTKDLELAKNKFEEGITKSIYLVDNRQSHHFKQLFSVLDKIGFSQAKDCIHLSYAHVTLPEGPMKSRDGNVIPITRLIDSMKNHIKTNYLESINEDKEMVADQIAKGAIFYGMLKTNPSKSIVFDMQEWLKLDGNTGPYLQYTAVRCNSILSKQEPDSLEINLVHEKEKQLAFSLSQFNKVMEDGLKTHQPSLVCSYLYDLSKSFNSFYQACPILKEEEDIKNSRLNLVKATSMVLTQGLAVLDIEVPKKM